MLRELCPIGGRWLEMDSQQRGANAGRDRNTVSGAMGNKRKETTRRQPEPSHRAPLHQQLTTTSQTMQECVACTAVCLELGATERWDEAGV